MRVVIAEDAVLLRDGLTRLLTDHHHDVPAVADVGDFLDAVARVGGGGTVLDPEVVAQLLSRTSQQAALARLTDRERQVLAAMTQGRSNASIATTLNISEGLVEKHVAGIFAKLNLAPDRDTNRRVLAVLAYLNG